MPARRRVRRPAQLHRCNKGDCRRRIVFLAVPSGKRLPFDASPVTMPDDGSNPVGAYPRYGGAAWNPDELIAEIQVARDLGVVGAVEFVRGLPWHRRHACAWEAPADVVTRERETADR